MSLSKRTKDILIVACADKRAGQELAAAIDAGGNAQAAAVAALGATSNLSALVVSAASIANSNFTAANAAEPTKAEIDAGIDVLRDAVVASLDVKADNADVETLRTQVEDRLDAIEAKIDAVIAAFKASNQMAT